MLIWMYRGYMLFLTQDKNSTEGSFVRLLQTNTSLEGIILYPKSETTSILCKGKYHCTADLLFDWLGFGQTSKSVVLIQQNSWIQTSQAGGQPYSDIPPYEVNECSLPKLCYLQWTKSNVNRFDPDDWVRGNFSLLWSMPISMLSRSKIYAKTIR